MDNWDFEGACRSCVYCQAVTDEDRECAPEIFDEEAEFYCAEFGEVLDIYDGCDSYKCKNEPDRYDL